MTAVRQPLAGPPSRDCGRRNSPGDAGPKGSPPGPFLLRLPWPSPDLSQNNRRHWRVTWKATKAYREEARAEAMRRGLGNHTWDGARFVVTFYPPDRRRRDVSNFIARMKPAIDGIADAIGLDDSAIPIAWPETFAEPVKNGGVLVEVQTMESSE